MSDIVAKDIVASFWEEHFYLGDVGGKLRKEDIISFFQQKNGNIISERDFSSISGNIRVTTVKARHQKFFLAIAKSVDAITSLTVPTNSEKQQTKKKGNSIKRACKRQEGTSI